jgi:hypothetical protein
MKVVTRAVTIGDYLVANVKELTVAEIRAWLSEVKPEGTESPSFDLVTDLLSFDGIGMDELYQFTDLTKEQIEQLPLSEMQKVAVVIKEVNSVFFNQYVPALNKLRERLASIPSNDPSAP